jgi:hypothetical protein
VLFMLEAVAKTSGAASRFSGCLCNKILDIKKFCGNYRPTRCDWE